MNSPHELSVSVIVPVFNGAASAARCVASLKRQTHPCVEFVFADDASTDGTTALLEEACAGDGRFRILRSDVHAGTFRCRKRGFEASRGDIAMFLDVDGELLPEACRTVARTMEETGVDMFVYGSTAVGDSRIPPSVLLSEQRAIDRQPFAGRLDGFDERRDLMASPDLWAGAVWNKALRRAVLEKAFSSYEPLRPMPYGDDLVQSFLVCMAVRSVLSDTARKLHRHPVGTGVSGKTRGTLSWERFERIAGAAGTADELERCIALHAGELGPLAPAIAGKWVSSLLAEATGRLAALPGERIAEGMDLMLRNWGFRVFASPLFTTRKMDALLPELFGAGCMGRRPARIRNVAMYYPRLGVGGVQRCLRLLSDTFLREGFAVRIVTDDPLPPGEREGFPPEAEFASLARDGETDSPLRTGIRCERWERLLRDHPADAVYYAAFNHPDLAADFLCIRAAGACPILHMHSVFSGPLLHGGARYFADLLRGYALADAVVALSAGSEAFFRAMGIPARYFPNPPSFPPGREGTCGPRGKAGFRRILWCGRISGEKQPIDAIRIFAEVRHVLPDVRLAILGDCLPTAATLRKAMEREAEALGCAGAIDWQGFVEDVRPWMDSSDFLLSTAIAEGFPMTFLEAFSRGLPVVAYDLPCVEPAKSPAAVRSVRQGDVEAAAAEAVRLLSDDASYAAASGAALAESGKFASFDQRKAWGELLRSLPESRPALPVRPSGAREERTAILQTLLFHAAASETKQEAAARKQLALARKEFRDGLRAERRKSRAELQAVKENAWKYLAFAARKRLGRLVRWLRR